MATTIKQAAAFISAVFIFPCHGDELSWFQADPVTNQPELHLEAGLGLVIFSAPDFQVSFRPKNSRWIFGYRYIETNEDDILSSGQLSKAETTLQGPNIRYIFSRFEAADFYAMAGYYEHEYKLICNINSTTVTEDDSSLSLGGGAFLNMDDHFRINFAVTLATGGKFDVDAGACRDEGIGKGDVIASIVFAF